LGGENYDYVTFYNKLGEVAGIKRKMYKVPLWMQMIFARFQLFRAERFGKEPMITPKWIAKGCYNWEVSPEKAIQELGLPVIPIEEGLRKTVEYVKSL
jgi:farnesol dehydrogenase